MPEGRPRRLRGGERGRQPAVEHRPPRGEGVEKWDAGSPGPGLGWVLVETVIKSAGQGGRGRLDPFFLIPPYVFSALCPPLTVARQIYWVKRKEISLPCAFFSSPVKGFGGATPGHC